MSGSFKCCIAISVSVFLCVTLAEAQSLRFTCDPKGEFPSTLSAVDLEKKFGKRNVIVGDVELGEGEKERGTILFPASKADRVSITWKEKDQQSNPESVRLAVDGSERSRWRGPLDVPTQIRLKDLEALNRKPFRLFGFAWDYSGTVASWAGGMFEQVADSACRFTIRMNPDANADRKIQNSVLGDREFSSGHPSMQRLNPKAYEFLLLYR